MHAPLLNIQFPANAFILFEELFRLVTYEVLDTEQIYPLYFDFPDRGALNEKFERLEYGSFYSIMCLGFPFIIILWLLFLYPVYLILRICNLRYNWPKSIVENLRKILFWKQWLVFTDAMFLELVIIVLLQINIVDTDWNQNASVFMSFIIWVMIVLLIL